MERLGALLGFFGGGVFTTRHSAAQHGAAPSKSSVLASAQPMRFETFPCVTVLYPFPGSWVEHLRVQATLEVSNMVVPRWNHVFLRVQATLEVSNMAVPSWNHVFSRVQARQGGI